MKLWSNHIQTLVLLLMSALASWLWFVDIFWNLAPNSSSYTEALGSIFFRTDQKEFFLGDTTDLQGTIWVFHHFANLVDGSGNTVLSDLYAPIGFDLGLNTGFAWADAALAYPYVKWIGIPGFYNLHIFITLCGNVFLLSMLFRMMKLSLLPAFGLSLLCIFQDFTQDELFQGRPTQVHWWFQIGMLMAMLKMTTLQSTFSRRWAIIGGVSLAGACLTYWFGGASLGFITAIVGIFYIGQYLIQRNKEQALTLVKNGSWFASVAILLTLGCTWRLSQMYLNGENTQLFELLRETPWVEWDFLGRTVPLTTVAHIDSLDKVIEYMSGSHLPETIWTLWLASLIPLGFKDRWPWIVGSTLALFLPLPSALNFGDIWIPSTNGLLHWIFPPMERCGFPERLVVAPILITGVSMGLLLATLEQRLQSLHQWGSYSGMMILGGWIGYQAIQEIPSNTPISSLQIDRDILLITESLPGGIIHVPVEEAGNAFVQQMFHQQPILTGPGADAVRPTAHIKYCEANSLLVALETLAKESHPLLPAFLEEDRQKLLDDGFKWIQVDLRKSASQWKAYEDLLGTSGIHRANRHLLALPLSLNDSPLTIQE